MSVNTSRFFISSGWIRLVHNAFGAKVIAPQRAGMPAWTIFRLGPMRIAYPDFPVGPPKFIAREDLNVLQPAKVHIARISFPQVDEPRSVFYGKGATRLPETVIHRLESWGEPHLPSSVRYKLRRARREGARIRPSRIDDGSNLYNLYRNTVSHHHGTLRYNKRYFIELCKLAAIDKRLAIYIVESQDGIPCGFAAGVQDELSAYYLHGGMDRGFSKLRPGYLALTELIKHFSVNGCKDLNLLTSPQSQPALVKFKEEFGGTTYIRTFQDVAFGISGSLFLHALRTGLSIQRLAIRTLHLRRYISKTNSNTP